MGEMQTPTERSNGRVSGGSMAVSGVRFLPCIAMATNEWNRTRADASVQGKDAREMMNGKVGWRLLISLESAVTILHPSRSANATYKQS